MKKQRHRLKKSKRASVRNVAPRTGEASNVAYYHGGIPSLRVGGLILPLSVTGNSSTERECREAAGQNHEWMVAEIETFYRRDRVFITAEKEHAIKYALGHESGNGWAYRVEPIGPITADPDDKHAGSNFECESARILEIVKIDFRMRQRRGNARCLSGPK